MEKDWSALAAHFDDLQRRVTGPEVDREIKSELAKLQNLGAVLELGCGNGGYTPSLLDACDSLLATDISEDMLRVAKERLKGSPKVSVRQASCYDTGLEAGAYDTVFMGNLIHVVAQPEEAMKEAHRLLKDRGRLVIVSFTPDGLSPLGKAKLIARYLRHFGPPPKGGTKFTLTSLCVFVPSCGFEIEDVHLLGDNMAKAIFMVARRR
ncbi:MAG: methyltransferase type 11 [Bacteroidetes bacterium]|nr:MAG: methyltransferase type 11 [Bacteroidota bacterium]